jgi:hypothetical protein
VVLVGPDRQPDRARLLLIRAGRLVDEVSLQVDATPSHVRHLLRRTFSRPMAAQVSRDELDDLLIVDAWLRRHADVLREVGVPPAAPESAAPEVRDALRACRAAVATP